MIEIIAEMKGAAISLKVPGKKMKDKQMMQFAESMLAVLNAYTQDEEEAQEENPIGFTHTSAITELAEER